MLITNNQIDLQKLTTLLLLNCTIFFEIEKRFSPICERYKTEEQFVELGGNIEYSPYSKGISTSQIKQILDSNSK